MLYIRHRMAPKVLLAVVAVLCVGVSWDHVEAGRRCRRSRRCCGRVATCPPGPSMMTAGSTKTVTMRYWRENPTGPACLEYSWVPEGKRRDILLNPGMREGSSSDSISATLNPSHVQVYVLVNNFNESTEMWQFPPGPPYSSPIVSASVEVYTGLKAVGKVTYADGTTASDTHMLDPVPRKCPTGL